MTEMTAAHQELIAVLDATLSSSEVDDSLTDEAQKLLEQGFAQGRIEAYEMNLGRNRIVACMYDRIVQRLRATEMFSVCRSVMERELEDLVRIMGPEEPANIPPFNRDTYLELRPILRAMWCDRNSYECSLNSDSKLQEVTILWVSCFFREYSEPAQQQMIELVEKAEALLDADLIEEDTE